MYSKVDLFFTKLCLVNSFLLTALVIILKKVTQGSLTGNVLMDYFPSAFLLLGAWAFTKSKEIPYPLLVTARVSMLGAFFGILFGSVAFYKEWRTGIYNKPPYKKTAQIIYNKSRPFKTNYAI